jgi:hypothetical protein
MNNERSQSLVYLDHATERMDQRRITPAEVEEVALNAVAAPARAGRVTLEGSTAAGRRLNITRLEHFPVIVSVVDLAGPSQ